MARRSKLFLLGGLGLAVWAIVLIAAALLYHARLAQGAQAQALIGFASAEQAYVQQNGRYGTLLELMDAGLITPSWLSAARQDGYKFRCYVNPQGTYYWARCEPPLLLRLHPTLYIGSDTRGRVVAEAPWER